MGIFIKFLFKSVFFFFLRNKPSKLWSFLYLFEKCENEKKKNEPAEIN